MFNPWAWGDDACLGACIQTSRSSSLVKITGMWTRKEVLGDQSRPFRLVCHRTLAFDQFFSQHPENI
jgi:hypothetical protein